MCILNNIGKIKPKCFKLILSIGLFFFYHLTTQMSIQTFSVLVSIY